MTYGVWCQVWGGVTGSRAGWLKENGKPQVFATLAEAEQVAAEHQASIKDRPHGSARFSYTAEEMMG